jgi:RNA polymerase subunit RPABC4/transcription elongation factor Spt4
MERKDYWTRCKYCKKYIEYYTDQCPHCDRYIERQFSGYLIEDIIKFENGETDEIKMPGV